MKINIEINFSDMNTKIETPNGKTVTVKKFLESCLNSETELSKEEREIFDYWWERM